MDKQNSMSDKILKEIAASNMKSFKRAAGGILISFAVTAELWQCGGL